MKATAIAVGVFASAALLAGCGSGQNTQTTTGAASTEIFNDVDVTFAQTMIVHHQQAIVIAGAAQQRARSAQVRQLARRIIDEQQPEIEMMNGWLRVWRKPVPGTTTGIPTSTSAPMPHMSTMMPRMPSTTPGPELSEMLRMHGVQFDEMFLRMMISHHEDGVAMAKVEQAAGANPQAKQLAKNIETGQTAEIAQMRNLLSSPTPYHS